jgi:hypothetical protein
LKTKNAACGQGGKQENNFLLKKGPLTCKKWDCFQFSPRKKKKSPVQNQLPSRPLREVEVLLTQWFLWLPLALQFARVLQRNRAYVQQYKLRMSERESERTRKNLSKDENYRNFLFMLLTFGVDGRNGLATEGYVCNFMMP